MPKIGILMSKTTCINPLVSKKPLKLSTESERPGKAERSNNCLHFHVAVYHTMTCNAAFTIEIKKKEVHNWRESHLYIGIYLNFREISIKIHCNHVLSLNEQRRIVTKNLHWETILPTNASCLEFSQHTLILSGQCVLLVIAKDV